MVSTSSPQPENDTKRQRHTLEKAKVVNLSKQLQIRLQYARLKVEHGWQRQSLNEVENLYFHHSTLKGKSKARSVSTVASPFTPSTTNGPSPKKTSVDSFPEPKQGPPIVPVPSPPPAVVVSPPPTTTHPLVQGTGTPSPPDYSTLAVEGPSSLTPSTTPAPAPASFPPSVLSAFSQNYTVSQRTATMDFSTLSPFVSPSPFATTPSASLAAPSSFVAPAPFPPQQTLAYPPSPFAPPQPSPAAIAVPHFTPPVIMQASGTSIPLSSFPALVQTQPQPQPPPSPASVPAPVPTPSPPSRRTPARRTPTPVPPPPVSSSSSSSSFRPSQKTFDIPTAPPPLGGAAGAGTLGMQNATTTTLLTYDSFWSSHVSAAAAGGGGVGGWRSRAAAGGMPTAPTGTAAGTAGGGTKT